MIIKDVSAAELEVMEIIWAAGKPVIITDIWQAIEGHDWTYQTVQTFVNRLNMKGFIKSSARRFAASNICPFLPVQNMLHRPVVICSTATRAQVSPISSLQCRSSVAAMLPILKSLPKP